MSIVKMENCHLTRNKLIQNLRDAGCDADTIENYFSAMDAGNKKQAMSYIEKHRDALLHEFHKCSNCIDCLDYFIIQSEKK